MSKTVLVGLAILGTIAIVIVVLAGGGDTPRGTADATSDVVVGDGASAPTDVALADITDASAERIDGDIVFEVVMAKDIDPKATNDVLSFRWELTENGQGTWLVDADLGGKPTAAVTSQTSNFGASTIDDTLPGEISVDGDTVTVSIDARAIEGFPTAFGWTVTSSLDADRADASSAVATDQAPDSGPGKVE